jgi:hypothetical protein
MCEPWNARSIAEGIGFTAIPTQEMCPTAMRRFTCSIEYGGELWRWLEEGGHVYVCGDARRMASDVDRELHEVVARFGSRTPDEAKSYLDAMGKAKRYQREVY